MSARQQWVERAQREHAERTHAVRAMAPSTCKRTPRQPALRPQFVVALLSVVLFALFI